MAKKGAENALEGMKTIDKNLKNNGINVGDMAGKAGKVAENTGNEIAKNAEKILKEKGIDLRGSA